MNEFEKESWAPRWFQVTFGWLVCAVLGQGSFHDYRTTDEWGWSRQCLRCGHWDNGYDLP